MDNRTDEKTDHLQQAKAWLTRTHTLTLPVWTFVAAGLGAFVLLLVALD